MGVLGAWVCWVRLLALSVVAHAFPWWPVTRVAVLSLSASALVLLALSVVRCTFALVACDWCGGFCTEG